MSARQINIMVFKCEKCNCYNALEFSKSLEEAKNKYANQELTCFTCKLLIKINADSIGVGTMMVRD